MIKLNRYKESKHRPWQKYIDSSGVGTHTILKSRALGLAEEYIVPKHYINHGFNYTSYLKELKGLPEVKNKLSNL